MTLSFKVTANIMLLLLHRLFWYILLFAVQDHGSCMAYDPEASITGLYTGPYFDPLTNRNLTAHLGDQAALPCTVRQLGDKSVSWVRMRDSDILTVDRYTFVSDERFKAFYIKPQETWNLVIMYVQERDAGWYECQVSTEPKMSQMFNLRVVVPKVKMVPPGDRYVKTGSEVRINCHITDVVQHPDYIFWYHNQMRVMDSLDPNIQIRVQETGPETIVSALMISRVENRQSGNYTCMPSNLHSSSAVLHVLIEEPQAAMQDGSNLGSHCFPCCDILLATVLLTFYLQFANKYWQTFGYFRNDCVEPTERESTTKRTTETHLWPAKTDQLYSIRNLLTKCLFNKCDSPTSLGVCSEDSYILSSEQNMLPLHNESYREEMSLGESIFKLMNVTQLVEEDDYWQDPFNDLDGHIFVAVPAIVFSIAIENFSIKNIILCSQVNHIT